MFENKLFVAICISTVLAILIFRTNYVAALAVQRQKYSTPEGNYRYDLLLLDIFVTIIFALIGCYIAWASITVISGLHKYEEYKFLISILNGLLFQQILPILIEIVMNKIHQFKEQQLGISKKNQDDGSSFK